MSQVWGLVLTHCQQAVMLVLADHAKDDGTKAYPGVYYTAWKTNYSPRQVQRAFGELERTGLIIPEAHSSGGRGLATEYSLHLEKGVIKSPFIGKKRVTSETNSATEKGDISDTERVTSETQRVTSATEKGDIAMSPQPSVTILEPSLEPSADAIAPPMSDHSRMMKALSDRTGPISDGAAQGKAVKWLRENGDSTVEDYVACLDFLLLQDWRDSRVSWLTVAKEFGTWKFRLDRNAAASRVGAYVEREDLPESMRAPEIDLETYLSIKEFWQGCLENGQGDTQRILEELSGLDARIAEQEAEMAASVATKA